MKQFIVTTFLLGTLLLASCRDTVELNRPDDYLATRGITFAQAFESFWTGMNHNYLFWDIDPTDWDEVYRIYQPKFADLDVANQEDMETAYTYYQEMTKDLVDGHFRIDFGLGLESIIPSNTQRGGYASRTLFLRPNQQTGQFELIPTIPSYLNEFALSLFPYSANESIGVVRGLIADEAIPYFFFNGFALLDALTFADANLEGDSPDAKAAQYFKSIISGFFDNLKRPDLKGIIIDIRGNGGGNLVDLNFLLGHLITEERVFMYTRTKAGEGRLDYSPWAPFSIFPSADAQPINCPIVLIVDKYSVSCSEFTAMAISSLPNGHVLGERTWGGQGPLTGNIIFNGGQFNSVFPSFVYTSSAMSKTADGKIYEGIGFPPDEEVLFDQQAFDNGTDVQLEAAIRYINAWRK